MGREMHGVDEGEDACLPGQLRGARHIGNRTERVGCRADREQFHAGGEPGLQRGEIQLEAGLVEGDSAKGDPSLPGKCLPGSYVGVMIQLGDEDLVARAPTPAQ